jgi:hypothetical protein
MVCSSGLQPQNVPRTMAQAVGILACCSNTKSCQLFLWIDSRPWRQERIEKLRLVPSVLTESN